MKAYLITYDLRSPNRNYTGLYESIKASPKWWHYLESSWIIRTEETSVQVWNRLARQVDRDDSVLVIEVRNNASGWLPKDAWDWIKENISS